MSYLLYCILDGQRRELRHQLRFLGYPQPSILVQTAGLGAVASKMSRSDSAPGVARLLVYSKIVEWFNRERTVIPMRYGCSFNAPDEIRDFLEQRRHQYLRLFEELDNRVEMSVRVTTINEARPSMVSHPAGPSRGGGRFAAQGLGTVYLTERREHYRLMKESQRRRDEISRRICAAAEGTYVRSSGPGSVRSGTGALCVHFLVDRDQVARFNDALLPLSENAESRTFVTGPWPPYNFVAPADARTPS